MPLFLGTCRLEPSGLSWNTVARASPLDMDTAVLRSQAPAGDPTGWPPTPKGPPGEAGLRCVVGTYLSLRSLSQQDCPPPPCPHPAKPVLLSVPSHCMLQPFSSLPSSLAYPEVPTRTSESKQALQTICSVHPRAGSERPPIPAMGCIGISWGVCTRLACQSGPWQKTALFRGGLRGV